MFMRLLSLDGVFFNRKNIPFDEVEDAEAIAEKALKQFRRNSIQKMKRKSILLGRPLSQMDLDLPFPTTLLDYHKNEKDKAF